MASVISESLISLQDIISMSKEDKIINNPEYFDLCQFIFGLLLIEIKSIMDKEPAEFQNIDPSTIFVNTDTSEVTIVYCTDDTKYSQLYYAPEHPLCNDTDHYNIKESSISSPHTKSYLFSLAMILCDMMGNSRRTLKLVRKQMHFMCISLCPSKWTRNSQVCVKDFLNRALIRYYKDRCMYPTQLAKFPNIIIRFLSHPFLWDKERLILFMVTLSNYITLFPESHYFFRCILMTWAGYKWTFDIKTLGVTIYNKYLQYLLNITSDDNIVNVIYLFKYLDSTQDNAVYELLETVGTMIPFIWESIDSSFPIWDQLMAFYVPVSSETIKYFLKSAVH